jgi:cell division protein FtsN
MADEGFREIQLSGKQLAALFMGAAVLLVVTFLCGVLVGRGVRAQKEPPVAAEALATGAAAAGADPTAGVATPQPEASTPPAQPPSTPPPSPPAEEPSYYSRLESQGKPGEAAPAAKETKAEKAGGDANVKPAPLPAPPAAPAAAGPANGEPPGEGYALRVAAYKGKAQADALAARLSGKGYGTWVVQLPATTTGPGLFSVRVGKYKTSKEADAARRRLQKEEKLKPSLITR